MTLDNEILAGKIERDANKLVENIDFSDNIYNVKYSDVGCLLREFDYNDKIKRLVRFGAITPKEGIALRESVAENLNREFNRDTALELAKIYLTLK